MKRNSPAIRWVVAAVFLYAVSAFSVVTMAQETNLPPGERPPLTDVERVAEAGVAEDYEGANHIIVYDYSINRMKESGVTYVNSQTIYKVLTTDGCRNLSVLTWGYDPQSSLIDVQEVSIIRGDEVIPVDISKVKDLPAPQSMIYWSDRIKTLQLPRLEVNDGIDIKVFKKGYNYALLGEDGDNSDDDSRYIPPMAGEYFDIVRFEATVPIVEKKYVLSIPKDKRLLSEVYNGPLYSKTHYTADSTYYAWWTLNMPSRPIEPRQPGADDIITKVVMVTADSWQTKSKWFFDVNNVRNNQFVYNDAIKAKVDEIFKEAGVTNGTEEEKAKALVHWVAQNIRYSGQTMGEGEGFTLHPGIMIFEQRSGVCKDIAGMLITMMRAAGMDSYAAMTMAGSRIEDIPADQFNHCVVALKKKDGSFEMYDPTWVPYNNDIWSKLETEQQFLLGVPEGADLREIPYSPPEESPLYVTHEATLSEDGTLEGTFTFRSAGALDSRLRRIVTRTRLADLASSFARMLSPISDRVEGITYTYHKNDDFSENMWIKLSYRIPQFGMPVNGGLEFKSPMLQVITNHGLLFRAAATNWTEERKTDVFLYYTQLVDGTETIRLPKKYHVVETPSAEEIDETYAYFKGDSETKKHSLVVRERAEVRRRQIPPDGYAGFYAAMKGVKDWSEKVYRIEKGGAK